MSETTNNMNVPSVVPVSVKQTGYQTVEGCNPGDHRPQADDAVLPSNPAPRDAKGQSKVGGGE
ncbi:MAG: hypothetical protein ACJ72H_28610 [Candidatus Sulfotelmatobacter sp.]